MPPKRLITEHYRTPRHKTHPYKTLPDPTSFWCYIHLLASLKKPRNCTQLDYITPHATTNGVLHTDLETKYASNITMHNYTGPYHTEPNVTTKLFTFYRPYLAALRIFLATALVVSSIDFLYPSNRTADIFALAVLT